MQTDTATITYATTTCTLSTPRLTARPIWAPLVHANFLPPSCAAPAHRTRVETPTWKRRRTRTREKRGLV
jgi:hypothetical protein